MIAYHRSAAGRPTFSSEKVRAWDDAERKYLLEFVAKLPDPSDYASQIPAHVAAALLTVRFSKRDGRWWVEPEQARILIPYGLCEAGMNLSRHGVAGFGLQVYRELKKDGG